MAKSKIDMKRGKPAKSTIYPLLVEGNKSKVKVVIESGRTHQIRVHLNSIGFPILGDAIYGRTAQTNIIRSSFSARKSNPCINPTRVS